MMLKDVLSQMLDLWARCWAQVHWVYCTTTRASHLRKNKKTLQKTLRMIRERRKPYEAYGTPNSAHAQHRVHKSSIPLSTSFKITAQTCILLRTSLKSEAEKCILLRTSLKTCIICTCSTKAIQAKDALRKTRSLARKTSEERIVY